MADTNFYTFIFIGKSGCGKGTQAKLLTDYVKAIPNGEKELLYIETGHRFRDFVQGTSYSSRLSREIMDKGNRQPDFLAAYMWSRVVTENFTGSESVILDGTPRSLNEARMLDTAMEFYKRENIHVINIDVSGEWAIKRLSERGRKDDMSVEEINKRLGWYDKDVQPAVDYYEQSPRYVFHKINGERSIEEIHQDIINRIWPK